MVANIPKNLPAGELDNGYKIRRAAIDLNIPLITNARLASAFISAFCTMSIDDIAIKETSVLLLPGADTWSDPKHGAIIKKASELLSLGATVGAICGATVALANFGLLDNQRHTSNGQGFLEMFSPAYKGQDLYVDKPSVADNNLITANPTGALLWAKQIIEHCFSSKHTGILV